MESSREQEDDAPARPSEELLAEGKRCFAAGDTASAVECFQDACAQLAAIHGQVAKEMAEPYYLYGRALLEVARRENTVLGQGIPVTEDKVLSSDEEEEDEEEQENGEVGEGGGISNGDPTEGESEPLQQQPEDSLPEAGASATEVPGPSSSDDQPRPSGTDDQPGPSGTDDQPGPSGANDLPGSSGAAEAAAPGEGETEEESDLKLAWEVLELARLICLQQESDEGKLKLADVTLALGEVGLEADQYDQAIGDLRSCLELRSEVLDPTDRRLAEVHFNLGLAYTLAKDVDSSIQEYKIAKETLEKRRDKLEAEGEGVEGEERLKLAEEADELQGLLPDLDSKIADAIELKKILEEKAKEEREEAEEREEEEEKDEEGVTTVGFGGVSSSADTVQQPPVSDISHLVRKRQQAEGEEEGEGRAAKRARPAEELSNGSDAGGKAGDAGEALQAEAAVEH